MKKLKIISYKSIGKQKTIDFEVDNEMHNFIGDGIVVSNSHAASYGYNTAATAYFKANHPKEFFLALLQNAQNESEPLNEINKIQKELKFFGIKLLPPCLLKGNIDFEIDGDNIRFGLSSIKGIANSALEKLNQFKPTNCNKFEMFQAAKQAGLSCGVMAALIMSGALDVFVNETRSKLSFECLLFSRLKDKERLYCIAKGNEYNFDLLTMCKNILEWTDSLGKKVARRTRLETLRKNTREYLEIYRNNTQYENLAIYWWENYLLGFSYSTTLKKIFGVNRPDLLNLEELLNLYEKESGIVVVKVIETFKSKSKKGNKMAKLIVSDETVSEFKTYLCGRAYAEYFGLDESRKLPEIGDLVALKMRKTEDGSAAFIEQIQNQEIKIYTKMADLKDLPEEKIEKEKVVEVVHPLQQTLNLQEDLVLEA